MKRHAIFGRLTKFVPAVMAMAVLTIAGLNTTAANAEDAFKGILMSPASAYIDLHAGEIYNGEFYIRNASDEAKTIAMGVEPYTIVNDNYNSPSNDEADIDRFSQMHKWVTLSEREFTLNPGEKKYVDYFVKVPDNPPAGTQHAVIFAEADAGKVSGEGITTITQLGLVLRANVLGGDTVDKSNILNEKIDFFQPVTPIKGTFQIKNEGNIDARVKTTMTVNNAFTGKTVYQSTADEETFVYPETTRNYNLKSSKLGYGFYNVEMKINLNGREHVVKQLVCTIPLWIFILIGIAIACLVLYIVMRRDDKKTQKASKTTKRTTKKSSKK